MAAPNVGVTAPTNDTPLSTMASALLFGTVLFATGALATRSYLVGDSRPFQTAGSARSAALDVRSLPSVYTLLYHTSVFGFILFYAYVCEKHPPYPHMGKNYDADQFFFLTVLLFVVSYFTMKSHVKPSNNKTVKVKESGEDIDRQLNGSGEHNVIRAVAEANDATEVLNRDQTEEWKGWMQFMFLLYHYYHAEEVYNSIRIMITCYVWMTGFGNFSFFYLKADYGIIRVLQMLWRLNFLVLFLCLTQGTTYILYYICLLHTYFFFMVYVTMRIENSVNYTKWGLRIKLAILALAIFCIWDIDSGLFQLLHYPFLGTTPMLGANGGAMWEWYFRSALDHWSTFLGMVFALNFPITSLFYRKLEAQPRHVEVLAKGAMGLALFAAFVLWAMGPFRHAKFEYNQTNAYFGFIPLIVYIYFRNLTPWLRGHTFELLHQIGKTTLETYLMQHHIWLTSNAKSLLTLVPGWPKMNFLIVSIIYVLVSRRLYQLTLFLRGMMLPDDKSACFRNLFGLAATVGTAYAVAFALDSVQMLSLETIGLLSVVFGVIVYRLILGSVADAGDAALSNTNIVSKGLGGFTPMWTGAGIVLVIGLFWNHMISTGAARLQPLPQKCDAYVNHGSWVSIDGCDEGLRHTAQRQQHIYTESLCTSTDLAYLWAWDNAPSNSLCRFTHRDAESLKKTLQGRNIMFVGDSMTRLMYHSFSRQLGVANAGAYNSTVEKHADIEREIGDLRVDFRWAAYVADQVEKLNAIKDSSAGMNHPDLVFLGGSAWDKLWKYATDDEKKRTEQSVDNLVMEMNRIRELGIPVVWLIPTTINTAALPNEGDIKKQERISEEEMEKMRAMYKSKGVNDAASLVIDGRAFTKERTSESYDGVHYPVQVYSAGSQSLANALDWLLKPKETTKKFVSKEPGEMAHPHLGLMILCFTLAGLVGFDGFMGFTYVAAIFAPCISPQSLYYEAFSTLHKKKKLPEIQAEGYHIQRSSSIELSDESEDKDEESVSLLNKES